MNRLLTSITAAAAIATASASTPASGRISAEVERFTAIAVDAADFGVSRSAIVEIVLTQWSPPDECDMLLGMLFDRGPAALLDEFRHAPRVGYVRVGSDLGYDLHLAHEARGRDGERRITLVTGRRMSPWETRGLDYPFTVIELRVGRDGAGDGTMWMAARITGNPEFNLIEIENFATPPVRLIAVQASGRRPGR